MNSDVFITEKNHEFDTTVSHNPNLLRGKKISVSVYVEFENAVSGRIGAEPGFKFEYGGNWYAGLWIDGAEHKNFKGIISKTFTVPDRPITEMHQNGIYQQLVADKAKVGDLQIEILDDINLDLKDLVERLKYIDEKLDKLEKESKSKFKELIK